MLIELPIPWIIALNVGGWLFVQLALAWIFTRLPASWFSDAPAVPSTGGDRFYESTLGIRRWKDLLPDGARWFAGGFAKSSLRSAEPDYLRRFIRETRRGERCHWLAIAFAPVFFLWNPWWGDLVIIAYALAANLPCILAQRYNRGRLSRLLARPARSTRRP